MRHVPSTALILLSTCLSAVAHANGTTLMPGGAASVSRGGANAARPEDATAMLRNPAGLAFIPGAATAGFDLAFQRMCVDPYGYYGWGVDKDGTTGFGDQNAIGTRDNPGYAATPLSPVCNSAGPGVSPQFGGNGYITDRLAWGIGFLAPGVGIGMQFGGDDSTVQTPYGPRPTPTRYTLVQQKILYANAPAFSLAYRLMDQLAAGMTLQILSVRASSTQVQNPFGGTAPSTDFLSTVTAQDLFIPTLTFSVHARPASGLNLMGAFKWSDDFRGSGDIAFETNTYYRTYQGVGGSGLENAPFKNAPARLSEIVLRLPWAATGGIRYADLLKDNKDSDLDPMATERWDVEFDFDYSFDGRTSSNTASLGQDVNLVTHTSMGQTGSTLITAQDVGSVNINRHINDSYALRLGGSYSVLPRKFAVSAGVFYESRGIDLAYADIDSFAFQRIGMSIGIMARFKDWDLRVGGTQIVSETVEVAPSPSQNQVIGGSFDANGNRIGGKVLRDPEAPSPSKADAVAAKPQSAVGGNRNQIINAGRYTASFDVLSVGATFHF
jgi:hypothetical protein